MSRDSLVVRNRIRVLRFEAGEMTQQGLAERVGVSRQTINAVEAAKYAPSLEVAFRIARVFDKPIGEVFFVDDRETPG
jgi:putative transcriptional regulator